MELYLVTEYKMYDLSVWLLGCIGPRWEETGKVSPTGPVLQHNSVAQGGDQSLVSYPLPVMHYQQARVTGQHPGHSLDILGNSSQKLTRSWLTFITTLSMPQAARGLSHDFRRRNL